MGLTCSSIAPVGSADFPRAYLEDELGYHAAYKQHYAVAKLLIGQKGFEREAYYSLLMAMECFLKNLFCIVRFNVFSDVRTLGPQKFREGLSGRVFQHDLSEIAGALFQIFPELQSDTDFLVFKAKLPKTGIWINTRYDDPTKYSKVAYNTEFRDLDGSFAAFASKRFGSLK